MNFGKMTDVWTKLFEKKPLIALEALDSREIFKKLKGYEAFRM